MGIVAGLGAAAAAASLAGSVSSLAGGGASGGANGTYGGNPSTYIPQAQPQADQQYQNLLSQLDGSTGFLSAQSPSLQNAYSNFLQNPYQGPAQAGANAAGSYGYNTLAPMQEAGAQGLQNLGNQEAPYGTSLLQAAFDPQTALYNQTAQNVLGQSAVANAQSGVQGPAAAGVTDNNLNNFNINWQNNQLSRELQGIQGYGGLENTVGQAYSGASGLGGAATTNLAASSALPYTTNLGQLNNIFGQYSNLAGATTTNFSPELNALQSYLGLGQSATGLAQTGQNSAFNQNQTLGSNLGSALSSLSNNQGLSNLFGGSGASAGASTYNSFNPSAYSSPDVANTDISAFYGQ